MGACLEPTPDMGPYRVEIRTESFNLSRVDPPPGMHAGRYVAVVPTLEYEQIGAALNQVVSHPQWVRWEEAGRPAPDPSWVLPPGEDGPAPFPQWEATCPAGELTVRGPWITGQDRIAWGAEITFADTTAFLHCITRAAMS